MPPIDCRQIDHLQVVFQSWPIIVCYKCISTLSPITTSEYISEFTRTWPPCPSPSSLTYGLGVHFSVQSLSVTNCIFKLTKSQTQSGSLCSIDPGLQVHVQACSIMASQYISDGTQPRSPIVSPNLLDHGLRGYKWVHTIEILRRNWNCSQSPLAARPDILCVDG